MKIGEIAEVTGLTVKSIRYYELLQLMPEAPRTESGYRLYGQDAVQRLLFIKKAKRLGLSLDEIRDILALHENQQAPCVHVMALLDRAAVSYQAVLTKCDKVTEQGLARLVEEIERELAAHAAALPQVLPTSARSGRGIPELRAALAALAAPGAVP